MAAIKHPVYVFCSGGENVNVSFCPDNSRENRAGRPDAPGQTLTEGLFVKEAGVFYVFWSICFCNFEQPLNPPS